MLTVPTKARFPQDVTTRFLGACKYAGGSAARCQCVIDRQELRPVEHPKIEKGQVFAELFLLEFKMRNDGVTLKAAMSHAVPLPPGLRGTLDACKST